MVHSLIFFVQRIDMWRILLLIAIFGLSECKEFSTVRLVGGSSSSEGRVEIFHNGMWGTICDDQWDLDDAKVVCRSLGLPDAIGVTHLATFGQGSGQIWLDEVQCSGNEMTLDDCLSDDWGNNNCGHGEDAGVICGHPEVVNVKVSDLAGVITSPGYPHNMQRADYEWKFTPSKSNVNVFVCFEDIDLRTYGNEGATVEDSSDYELFSLENSRHESVCVAMENAGGKVTFYAPYTTERDDRGEGLRIRYAVVDKTQREGFCTSGWDISVKGEAGSIDLSWNAPPKESKSGYTYLVVHSSTLVDVSVNVTNSTSVTIDNLDPGTEYSVQVVAIPLVNKHNSALFSCSKRVTTKKERTRVTFGKTPNEGYVQVYHGGQWHRVCGNYWWDIKDANVACRSMGMTAANRSFVMYPKVTKKNQEILLGNSLSNLFLSGLQCSGREKNLLECSSIFGWTKQCYRSDAGLVCKKPQVQSIWRISGGMFPNEGLIEVYYNNIWGRVCSEYGWNINSATVACRSMGLPAPPFALKYVSYWKPSERDSYYYDTERKKSWIKNPKCVGTEKSLADCKHGEMKEWNCRYSQYAHLVCGYPKVHQIRINDTIGVITSPGYPQFTKQAHYEWTFKHAAPTHARVLLYFDVIALSRNSPVPNERSSITVKDGINTTLFHLQNKVKDRAVVMGTSDVRVSFYSSFTYVYAGRGFKRSGFRMRYLVFERPCHQNWSISTQGRPGRILISWTEIEKITGERDSNYEYLVIYNSTKENIKTVLTTSTTVDIDYLSPDTLYTVGVFAYLPDTTNHSTYYFCSKDFRTDNMTTRLVGGITHFEGEIEVFHDGIWSTVCEDDDWDINDAQVACRSMGLPSATYFKTYSAFGSYGYKKKWLRALKCKGNETHLGDCKHAGWGNTRWCFSYDAGVVCGKPSVEHFNITNTFGAITSPGFYEYMPMMHHVYHFASPAFPNAKLILNLENIWLDREWAKGDSILTIEDGRKTTVFQAKNKNTERKVIEITSWPTKIDVYSSFTVSKSFEQFGVNIKYIVVNESCPDWNMTLIGKPGMILVTMENLGESLYEKYKYVVFYNSSTMATNQAKAGVYRWVDIHDLVPKTLYTVSAFGFPNKHSDDEPYRYCTKNVRTKDVHLRLSGGKFPNEGRLDVRYSDRWRTVCARGWDLDDAMVACRQLGLPEATHALIGSEFGDTIERSVMNRVQCAGNETSISDCPHDGWDFLQKDGTCSFAGIVCGRPQVSSFNITSLTDMLTSPGYPGSLDQADYEWTFRPPMSNAIVLLCIEQLDLIRGSSGTSEVSVVDADGRQVFSRENEKTFMPLHVLVENNPSTLTFRSPFTHISLSSSKGFKLRYFIFNESCKGDWNISIKHTSGSIHISWSLAENFSSRNNSNHSVVYNIVYFASAKRITSQVVKNTSYIIDNLKPNTEYVIRLFAFVPGSKELNFCSRHVRTDNVKWRLTGGKLENEGVVEVYYKGEWGAICGDYTWDLRDAAVACRSLGLPSPTYAPEYGEFSSKNTSKFWMSFLQCFGHEKNLAKCTHGKWDPSFCMYPGNIVCGSPKVESHDITEQSGFISSPGYPRYMLQAHHKWTFNTISPNTRIFIEFEKLDLTRSLSGTSEVKVEDDQGTIFEAVNTKLKGRRRLLVENPINVTYFSSFTSKNRGNGMRMRYAFFDDSCSSKWSVTVKPGIGKLDVSWTPQLDDSDWNYLITYNATANQTLIIDTQSLGSATDYLPPNTMYTVTVLALHKTSTAVRYCTRHMRTRGEKFRLAGGRVPNEGRVEVYYKNIWSVVCEDDWDMNDAAVACRQTGFPAPTWVFRYSPFTPEKRKPFVTGPLLCKGNETSLWDCPQKDLSGGFRLCFGSYPASVICGRPAECKTNIKDSPKGIIEMDRYYRDRKVECEWTITAPSKTTPIVVTLKKLNLHYYSPCSESSVRYMNVLGREVHKYCSKEKNFGSPFVSFGFHKIQFRSGVAWYPWEMNVEYFIPNDTLDDIVEAPNWNITTKSRRTGIFEVQWPPYIPTDEDKSRNLSQVVKYIPICVALEDNGDVITATERQSWNTKATFKGLKYGEYKIYVLAYLGDKPKTPLTKWKKAARKSRSVTTKTKESYPSQPPMNITATVTGTQTILVTWEPIPQQYVNGILVGYGVYYSYYSDQSKTTVYERIASGNSYEIKDCVSLTEYTIDVHGFTNAGVGPSSRVSITSGYEVEMSSRYGKFQASRNSSSSNIHKTWKLGPVGEEFDQILIVFKTFDLGNRHTCSNKYVKVTDEKNTKIGTFCGKKLPFAISIPKGTGVALVTLHSNTALKKQTGFSAFYKVIDEPYTNQSSVWNLKVKNSTDTGAVASWDTTTSNVSDVMVLFKETSVQYIWQAVKASPVDNSIILKGLLPAKQYHLRLVGTIFGMIEESRLMVFTTKEQAKQEQGATKTPTLDGENTAKVNQSRTDP